MKRVFICSPYRGDVETNKQIAIELCRMAFEADLTPFCPHLLYPQILDEENESERARGIVAGLEFLPICDVMLVYTGQGITTGMQMEIDAAQLIGLPSYYTETLDITLDITLEITHDYDSATDRGDNVIPFRRVVHPT